MQSLDFGSKFGLFCLGSIQQVIGRGIYFTDFHNIDTVSGGGRNLDEFSADIAAGPVEFMAL